MKMYLQAATVIAVFGFLMPSTQAQTPPTPETTFTAVSGNLWGTAGNWDNGIPDPLNTSLDDALIGANQTNAYNQSINGNGAFGTLTLGAGAVMQNTITANQTFMTNKTVYLNNNSIFEITSGSMNSTPNFQMLPGATATLKGGMSMVQGSLSGAGNLNVILSSDPEWRSPAGPFSGNLSFASSSTAARRVAPSRFTGTVTFGTGTAIIGTNVRLLGSSNGGTANKMNGLGTLKVVGGPNTTQPKIDLGTGNNQTIGNLVVESVGTRTGTSPLLRTGVTNAVGTITVTNTVTFQGTASTVEIDDVQTIPAGNSLVTSNLTFTGTGSWTVMGDGGISVSGGTITMDVDATISNKLTAANGFTKAGSGTLTLGNPSGVAKEIRLSDGILVFATNANFSAGDYVLLASETASFTANYGGTFSSIGDVLAGIGPAGYFRPNAAAIDNGSSFTVTSPPAGSVIIVK